MSKLEFRAEHFPSAPHKNSGACYTAQNAADDANKALAEMLEDASYVRLERVLHVDGWVSYLPDPRGEYEGLVVNVRRINEHD